jgi:hypothetical protein
MPVRISAPNGNGTATWGSHMRKPSIWAANHGARVANLSWRDGAQPSSLRTDAARYFMERTLRRGGGCHTAGNDGLPASSNPPDNPYILASERSRQACNEPPSCRIRATGPMSIFAHPDVLYCHNGFGSERYLYFSGAGTSYSAPLVAAAAALSALSQSLISVASSSSNILKRTAVDLGPPGWDSEYGWGCVNAERGQS